MKKVKAKPATRRPATQRTHGPTAGAVPAPRRFHVVVVRLVYSFPTEVEAVTSLGRLDLRRGEKAVVVSGELT